MKKDNEGKLNAKRKNKQKDQTLRFFPPNSTSASPVRTFSRDTDTTRVRLPNTSHIVPQSREAVAYGAWNAAARHVTKNKQTKTTATTPSCCLKPYFRVPLHRCHKRRASVSQIARSTRASFSARMTSLPAPSSAGHPGASVDRGPRDVREEFAEHAALVLQPGAVVFRPTTTVFGSLEGPQETGVLHVQISKERLRLTGDAALRGVS